MTIKLKLSTFFMGFLMFFMVLQACNGQEGPKPIAYGKDQCAHCKMTVSDIRFGTQLKTQKGRVYNFDDVSCMVAYVKKGEVVKKEDVKAYYLPDYKLHKLFDAQNMYFFKSENLKSPMRGDIAAFSTKEEMEKTANEFQGTPLTWDSLWKN